ncbi:hypothetical protein CspeluHIS016_0201660 [Cutaneotrichosporon spelunceum]|uniref:Ubiquitin-like domain-containing protein n=1 Tax=Cutaneotrichosporon spelunceum TaxID=1672016 RepID=A0AAD3TQS8_9TREE|nr:hypothetical protein CspeluHIS016_0201660 [Cutaneotrichosporon spelunceum]
MNHERRDHGVRPASPPLPSPRAVPADGLLSHSLSALPMLRVHIQTPFADQGQNHHAWDAPQSMTVAEAKDAIASGLAGYGRWERDGLRLVWRGRILRDDDTLGAVLTDTVPTLHLVARPISPRRPAHIALPPSIQPTTQALVPTESTPGAAALADCLHYLLFAAREHLCALIGAEPLEWDKTYPAPTVSRDTAKAAVISVVRPYAESGAWVGWDAAFAADADDWSALQNMWNALGRDTVAAEIRTLWKIGTGRDFPTTTREAADIELDHTVYSLHLPALADMAPTQLIQLLQYLRTTTLLTPLTAALSTIQAPEPVPTPTVPAATPPQGITVRHAQRRVRLSVPRMPRITLALVQRQFWSAARLATVVWMFTRKMGWWDPKLWLLAGAAFGWWCVDGYNQWAAETRAARARARRAQRRTEAQARLADPEGNRARLEAVARGEAGREGGVEGENEGVEERRERPRRAEEGEREPPQREQRDENPLDPALMAAAELDELDEQDGARGDTHPLNRLTATLPLLHLESDAAELRLPDTLNVRRASSRPSVLVTYLLLPLYLWFVTLVPSFESWRWRAIRARERTMRAVVEELNAATSVGEGEHGEGEGEPLLPEGISNVARRYYTRVVAKGESIDWEEEREAQAAMGVFD